MELKIVKVLFFIGLIFSTHSEGFCAFELNSSNCEGFITQLKDLIPLIEIRVKGDMFMNDSELFANIRCCNGTLGLFRARLRKLETGEPDGEFYVNLNRYQEFLLKLVELYDQLKKIDINLINMADRTLRNWILFLGLFIDNVFISADLVLNTNYRDCANMNTMDLQLENQFAMPFFENPRTYTTPDLTYPQFNQPLQSVQPHPEFVQQPYPPSETAFPFMNLPDYCLLGRPIYLAAGGPVHNVIAVDYPPQPYLPENYRMETVYSDFNKFPGAVSNQPFLYSDEVSSSNTMDDFKLISPQSTDAQHALQHQVQFLYQPHSFLSVNNGAANEY